MKVLFDQNTPRNLRAHLSAHEVFTAAGMGWAELRNGDLLRAAESDGFDLFLTGDQELSYQQNLSGRRIAIIELTKNNWPSVAPHLPEIVEAVNSALPGSYRVVDCKYIFTPRNRKRK